VSGSGVPGGSGAVAPLASAEAPEQLLELEEAFLTDAPPATRVEIAKDPVFSWEKRTYQAYTLLDVARAMKNFGELEAAANKEPYALVFSALDRFKVTLPFEYLYNGKGYVAFKEDGRADGKDWDFIPVKEQAMTPAPYYVVWDIPEPSFDYPTPYQVAYFKILPMRKAFTDAFPNDVKLLEGFKVFANRCVWCHSVNLSGGRSSKEFNVPQNLTERMSREGFKNHFKGLIDYGARKPVCTFMAMKDKELDGAWAYLTGMKAQKLCATEAECEPFKNR
jgi:hypothetical protein